jgi:hypothetical protein
MWDVPRFSSRRSSCSASATSIDGSGPPRSRVARPGATGRMRPGARTVSESACTGAGLMLYRLQEVDRWTDRRVGPVDDILQCHRVKAGCSF